MNRLLVALVLGALVVGGCASPSRNEQAADKPLSLFYTASRRGEVTPCGCSMSPLGGVGREWNALRAEQAKGDSHALLFTGGTTFVAEASTVQTGKPSDIQNRAAVMAEALSSLRIAAVSPSLEDLELGIAFVKELESKFSLPMVSANLVDTQKQELIFRSALMVKHGTADVLVTGLTEEGATATGVQALDATNALKSVLTGAHQDLLVVVISNLPLEKIQAVRKQITQPTVWLGGSEHEPLLQAQALDRRNLRINPYSRGMYLSRIDLNLNGGPNGFIDLQNAFSVRREIEGWKAQVVQIEAELKTKKFSSKMRKTLQARKQGYELAVQNTLDIPTHNGIGLVAYTSSTLALNGSYDGENKAGEIARRAFEARSLSHGPDSY